MSKQSTAENTASGDEEAHGRGTFATRLSGHALWVQSRVRDATAPIVDVANRYLRPLLIGRATAMVTLLLVCAMVFGGLLTFLDRTLTAESTATLSTVGLVVVLLAGVSVGAAHWAGSHRTRYW
jgi:hypothetical protein